MRHMRLGLVRNKLPQPTSLRVARDDRRSRITTGQQRLAREQIQSALGLICTVAFDAVTDEQRSDPATEQVEPLSHSSRMVCADFRRFRPEGAGMQAQATDKEDQVK